MMKSLIACTTLMAAFGAAQAEPLPAPPMVKYTPVAQADCDTQTFKIYFSSGETALNSEAKSLLTAAQDQLAGCMIGPVSLSAVAADAANTVEAQQLAQARLDVVAGALDQYALTEGRVDVRFDPSSQANSTANPMSRAVKVQVSAWAPQIG